MRNEDTRQSETDQQPPDDITRRQMLQRSTAAAGFGGLGIAGGLLDPVTEPVGLLEACFVDQFKNPPSEYPTIDLTMEDPKTAGDFPEGEEEFVIFIHGFIEELAGGGVRQGFTFEQALRQNGYEKPTVTAFWNSNIPVYQVGQRRAETAGRRLASFLDDYLDEYPDTTIRLVGHSLGSMVSLETLSELVGDEVLESVSLLGAAVDPALVCAGGQYASGISNAAGAVHNYHSRSDYAVCSFSGVLELEFSPDLGCDGAKCGGGDSPPDNFEDVDVTDAVAAHCDYFRPDVGCVPQVVNDF